MNIYDLVMVPADRAGLGRLRARVVADVPGRVLEIGAGTGLNLAHYRRAKRVIALEPDPAGLERTRRRAATTRIPVSLVRGRAEELPFPDGSFDVVVTTFVFCSVADPARGLAEIRRVLVPGGEVRLLEHVRVPNPAVGYLQDVLTPPWSAVAGGCHLNRDTLRDVREAGFRVANVRTLFRGLVVEIRGFTPGGAPTRAGAPPEETA